LKLLKQLKEAFSGASVVSRLGLGVAIIVIVAFFVTKTGVTLGIIDYTENIGIFEYSCFLIFCIPFHFYLKSFISKRREAIRSAEYAKRLNSVVISQSHNELFYTGNVFTGSAILVKEVVDSLETDRASVWLYNEDESAIVCQQLYIESDNSFHQDMELKKEDYPEYFEAIQRDPVIVASSARAHQATECFRDSYLIPLGIHSMLDVPVWYRGRVIGVICIESLTPREWKKEEVDFVQILSSLYSFAYSVKEGNEKQKSIEEFEKFVNKATLVSMTDARGKITYVNDKFSKVSGWSESEVIGKDHSIVNSGEQPPGYWGEMYATVLSREIWNDIVTNKSKDGSLYYVDTYIKANFDHHGKLKGFTSIRQDVTELKRKEAEISNRMDAINRSNAVIEFDLNGNIMFANELFLSTLGYSSHSELVGKHHNLFVTDDVKDTEEYENFWKILRSGQFYTGEIVRKKKDGSLIHLQATYNPIIGNDGKVYRVMKIATDITKSFNQQAEIKKKNTYLEHAAKILRHDMHSGINTYIPRGLTSLERRITEDQIKELKIEAPLKMIKEGLRHTQKVYRGVYEFTNLVKKDVVLNRDEYNLKEILDDYLASTAYFSQVIISDLGSASVNESLFCTAVDNLIRNGLKYNDSPTKWVKIYRNEDCLIIEDNGRGMGAEDFKALSQPYARKEGQKETGTGLGLNICVAILEEHRFLITCERLIEGGTRLKITLSE
jgi:PAS domain S-box-containing protein